MKYEYTTETERGGKPHNDLLNRMGDAGWELCGVIPSHGGASDMDHNWPDVVEFIFKRLVQNAKLTQSDEQPTD